MTRLFWWYPCDLGHIPENIQRRNIGQKPTHKSSVFFSEFMVKSKIIFKSFIGQDDTGEPIYTQSSQNRPADFAKYFTHKSIFLKTFEGEMFIRSYSTILDQMFCGLLLNSQVIYKSSRVADNIPTNRTLSVNGLISPGMNGLNLCYLRKGSRSFWSLHIWHFLVSLSICSHYGKISILIT